MHKFLKFAPEQNVVKASLALLELDWMACGVTVQSITVTLNLLSWGLHGWFNFSDLPTFAAVMSYKPPKPTAIHVKHRTKSEHHIFFKLFIQSYQTPSPASLLQICYRQNVQQTQLHKKKKKKSLLRWRQSHWQVRLFSDDCDQSKNYFVAFSYLQKSFFRVYCIPSASDRSRVSPLVFCSPAALITHDKRSNTETGSIRI